MRRAALCAALLLTAAPAAAALPQRGALVPGRSLAGIHLGERAKKVEALLGFHGVCRGCSRRTLYFTYAPFERHGLAVELTGGRVSALYTLWEPQGWHAAGGLALGSFEGALTASVGSLPSYSCSGYTALYRDTGSTRTVYYISQGELWAFGLFRRGADPCR